MKHTALPWHIPKDMNYTVSGTDAQAITSTINSIGINPQEAIANAEYIVRACNCHEELVLTLTGALKELQNLCPDAHFEGYKQALANATK